MVVLITKKTARKIQRTVEDSCFETGGVLLGYRFLWFTFITETTIPPSCMSSPSKVEFSLDGEWHTMETERLCACKWIKPCVVGLWHSHICYGAEFSDQDCESNRKFADVFGSIVSGIVVRDQMNFSIWYISNVNGQTRFCKKIQLIKEEGKTR